ncbi:MAG: SO_0444 family Cu/Zn efflux transporter [Thioalkalivibrio sp.]
MDPWLKLLHETLNIAHDAAPWLLLGLLAAGLVKALIPETRMQRWLGGQGLAAVSRAAVIGAPLPLCSCGAIPTALALHRGGAGRGPTTAFLIGTPGIGVDSLAITYALLGPFMAISRALGAVVTAIATGMLVGGSRSATASPIAENSDSCCASTCASTPDAPTRTMPLHTRLAGGLRYAFSDVLDDIGPWLLAGLLIAGVIISLVPPEALAEYGSGFAIMLIMAMVGIPMYICATAATPIAVALILSGVSPGAALVFLLAGPITSMATLGILRREMGNNALIRYLAGIIASAVALGLLLDVVLSHFDIDVVTQMGVARDLLPHWLQWVALVLLVTLSVRPLRKVFLKP